MTDLPTASNLQTHHCVPCEGGTLPLTREEFSVYLPQLQEWEVVDEKQLKRTYTLANFRAAITFIDQIAEIAEAEGHHPDLSLHGYKSVTIQLSTHAIGGLSINDFVMAVKIDQIEK